MQSHHWFLNTFRLIISILKYDLYIHLVLNDEIQIDDMGSNRSPDQVQDDSQTLVKYPIMVRVRVRVRVKVGVRVRVQLRMDRPQELRVIIN